MTEYTEDERAVLEDAETLKLVAERINGAERVPRRRREPTIPTRPGLYIDSAGDEWVLTRGGRFEWIDPSTPGELPPESFGPFTHIDDVEENES